MFFIKSLKEPSDSFDILKYVTFCSGRTRSATFFKLKLPSVRTNLERHFYFNRLPRLWNSLPPISTVNSLYTIKSDLRKFLWSHFVTNFDPARPCSFHLVCPCSRCSHFPLSHNCNKCFCFFCFFCLLVSTNQSISTAVSCYHVVFHCTPLVFCTIKQ